MSAPGGSGSARQQGIAAAITEVSERASVLIHEEIELAKTEVTEKATKLAKGAIVAVAAGVFFLMALFFVLIGLAWLLYFELPIGNEFTYFWGFFAVAAILVVLGALAGWLAAKAVKSGAPPVPEMAIEEARKIRETVSSTKSEDASSKGDVATPPIPQPATRTEAPSAPAPPPPVVPQEVPRASGHDVAQSQQASADPENELGRGAIDGSTLGR